METYSTEEQVIGTWIDGKPLYRKIVLRNTSVTNYGINCKTLKIDTFIKAYGSWKTSNGISHVPFANSYMSIYYEYLNTETLNIIATTASTIRELFIEYTKTTD